MSASHAHHYHTLCRHELPRFCETVAEPTLTEDEEDGQAWNVTRVLPVVLLFQNLNGNQDYSFFSSSYFRSAALSHGGHFAEAEVHGVQLQEAAGRGAA